MLAMLLSVVINTYERPAALAQCLKALAADALNSGGGPLEVVVADDGGRCPLAPALAAWDARAGALRPLSIAHAGRAAARNAGLAAARGERVLFLGDDVLLQPGALARHRAVTDHGVAVVGPYPLRDRRGSPPFRRWTEPNPQDDIADPQNAGWLHFVTGNLSLDAALVRALGGFDPRFDRYGWEDLDLGLRFERAGGRVVFDPLARAVHEHPAPSRAGLWRREREMGYTAWVFYEKWRTAAPAAAEAMRFWDDPESLRPGPEWRRSLGAAAIATLDRLAPASRLNARLYERMIWAARLAGVAEAWRERSGGAAS